MYPRWVAKAIAMVIVIIAIASIFILGYRVAEMKNDGIISFGCVSVER